jgi:multiple sugar transport system permease protein
MAAAPTSLPGARPRRALGRRQRLWGWIFLAPWLLGFMLFFLGPMIASLLFSFTNYNLASPEPPRFVGLANWVQMFRDPDVGQALLVTGRFLLIAVPVQIGLAMLFALVVNARHLLAKPLYRTLFFIPVMVPFVASTLMWNGVFNSQSGWVNRLLGLAGIAGPAWLNDPFWITPMLTIMTTWGVGNAMVIFLAGLQGVPTELYEAARVDGAGPIYMFFKITLPMVSPVIFYQLVLALIGALQFFLPAYVLFSGNGGPGNQAFFFMMKLYKEAFNYFQMGYASTLAWGMFLVALLLTLALFGTARRWVYYAGGDA